MNKKKPTSPEKTSESSIPGEEQIAAPELLAKPEDAVKPVAVQNGRMHALYMSAGFERDKNKRKLVHLDFSITLEEGCDHLIPEKVKDAWLWMLNTENKLVEVRGIPAVTLAAFINPKISRAMIHLPAAEIVKAVVSCREEVGKGQSREIERFVFRLLVERTEDVVKFAAWHDGEELWITMPTTQASLSARA